jgi:hypothetical protein
MQVDAARVTGLGYFLPTKRLLSLGSFGKITHEAQICGMLNGINFDKKWVGLHFGRYS